MKNPVFAGIDLHSNNLVVGLVEKEGKRLKHTSLPTDLDKVDRFLKPYKRRLKGVAVESTFNWYWLVDGLRARSYPVELANPLAIKQYDGLKHTGDKDDAFFLGDLQRLEILPTGHVYDPELRPVRDILRRRLGLVKQRTALYLSSKSHYRRMTGSNLELKRLKTMSVEEAGELYEHPASQLTSQLQKQHIEGLTKSILEIEKCVLRTARKMPTYQRLQTIPGIGVILGLTIAMETGEIARFKTAGKFASYCRLVDSQRLSNGKKKGSNNAKCGNKYLCWAFIEGANFARRYDENSRRWFDRKAAKTNSILATKALAGKLAKTAWHMMKNNTDYQAQRMFPHLATKSDE